MSSGTSRWARRCRSPSWSAPASLRRRWTSPWKTWTRGSSPRPFLAKLPFLVPQRRMLPPLREYAQLEHNGERRLVGYVEASRGCAHLCTHCPIPPVYGGRFFVLPREIVLEDIRQQARA